MLSCQQYALATLNVLPSRSTDTQHSEAMPGFTSASLIRCC
jgi:hypothetical protein